MRPISRIRVMEQKKSGKHRIVRFLGNITWFPHRVVKLQITEIIGTRLPRGFLTTTWDCNKSANGKGVTEEEEQCGIHVSIVSWLPLPELSKRYVGTIR